MSEVLHGWCPDPYGRHEERWMSEGEPTGLVRDHGIETREPLEGEPAPMRRPPMKESHGDPESLPAESPALWLSSHSGWGKWSRWRIGTPLRTLYQLGATERRRLVVPLLDPGEEIRSDGPAYYVEGPGSDQSDQPFGHLLVATRRLVFVAEDDGVLTLGFGELRSVDLVKQKSGWFALEMITDGGEHWAFVALPRTVRAVRRELKKTNPTVLP